MLILISLLAFLANFVQGQRTLNSQIEYASPLTGFASASLEPERHGFNFQFIYLRPYEVSPSKGQFDFSILESLIQAAWVNNKVAIVRVALYAPYWNGLQTSEGLTFIPEWVINSADYDNKPNVNSQGFYADQALPDWTSATLQNYYKELISKYTEYFKDDQRIFITQGFFGLWAEGHAWPHRSKTLKDNGGYPSDAYQKEFFSLVSTSFKNANMDWALGIVAGASNVDSDTWMTATAVDSGDFDDYNHGTYDDTFYDSSVTDYNKNLHTRLNDYSEKYKNTPLGGELGYNNNEEPRKIAFMPSERFAEEVAFFKSTYMFCSGILPYYTEDESLVLKSAKTLGYKLEITKVETDNKSKTIITVRNIGIAPLYRDAYVAVNKMPASTSLKGIMPQESRTITVPHALPDVLADDSILIETPYTYRGVLPFEANNVNVAVFTNNEDTTTTTSTSSETSAPSTTDVNLGIDNNSPVVSSPLFLTLIISLAYFVLSFVC